MIKVLRPLLRGSTYTGVLFAVLGALAALPLALVALVPVAGMRADPYLLSAVLSLALWVALIGAVGLAGVTRRMLVRGARRLLRVTVPDPVKGASGERWRTPVFLVVHVLSGWVLLFGGSVLLTMAVALPGKWASGDVRISLFGWATDLTGGWSWVVAAVCLAAAAVLFVAVSGGLRRLAPRLLGPSAAERLAMAAERERALAERNRLAHELHDSIGHTLTAATIQAAVAGEVLAADPAAARAAMRSIEESTRAALEDLDYVLGVLRDEQAGTAPTRTLADLPELLDRLRHAGAVVEPEIVGSPERVHGTLSRAAYRILQEGLTNALRHGAGGPIRLRVVAGEDGLELSVDNEAKSGPSGFPTSGHGLPGLAERVRLLHGEFEAGPYGGGGVGGTGGGGPQRWRLAVRLPVRWAA
ncbi:two-component sensor histidine kinase [Kitasatospora xanthocidica]|uniref:sensor histidine kinase n=1 Tax=Kitasatospora xanthocidica TaxID=83382 RepID=UPI0016748871|nr:histidine kinase [Kitasatospora xanthocidica]GHF51826.1 two-component sensor histidine kinase [Kitasatospora xanthocidica]